MGIDRYEAGIIFDGKNPVIGFAKEDDGDLVSYKQYLESHAYDEAKERELFESFWSENMNLVEMDLHRHIYPMNSGWSYACHETNRAWMTWQACAKSRARSAE